MSEETLSAATQESIDQARTAYLKDVMTIDDEELIYLNRILKLQSKTRDLILNGNTPSVILTDFLYQGDMDHATNIDLLNHLGIRHIINTSNRPLPKSISSKCRILSINILDDLNTDIQRYFRETNEFLHSCKIINEKVLVHCHAGISRSSTIVLAYLLKYHQENLLDAYDYLLDRRTFAAPNYGFFIQLIRYEKELRRFDNLTETHPCRS